MFGHCLSNKKKRLQFSLLELLILGLKHLLAFMIVEGHEFSLLLSVREVLFFHYAVRISARHLDDLASAVNG